MEEIKICHVLAAQVSESRLTHSTVPMQKSRLVLLLLLMSEEQLGRKSWRAQMRHGSSRSRTGRQLTSEYQDGCRVRYPGLFDPNDPNRTLAFGSCPGSYPGQAGQRKCRKRTFDFERCCSGHRPCTGCPN